MERGFPYLTCKMAAELEPETTALEEKAWEEGKRTRERLSALMGQYLLMGYRMLNVNCADCENILMQTQAGENYCVFCEEVAKATISSSDGGRTTAVTVNSNLSSATFSSSSTKNKTPVSKTGSGAGCSSEHKVPIVCTGRTGDTVKLTTTPADHDTMTMCTDTKRARIRTNPAVTHLVGVPSTPPPDKRTNLKWMRQEQPQSPIKTQQHDPIIANTLPQQVYTETTMQCQRELISKLKWCSSELEKTQSVEHSVQLCRLITAAGEALKILQELPPASPVPSNDHSNT